MSSLAGDASPKPRKLLNAALWGAQALVFIGFVIIGWMKLFKPIPELAAMWAWTGQLPAAVVRGLAIIDITGGVGIFLPTVTRIKPGLTVLAAVGCVALQMCAMAFHIYRGEMAATPVNVVFLALSAFVLWGRRAQPVRAR
ncbi:DoxX family protein [Dyella nitratireducens]|uniref:DoxX family protein n=1 Tax=Dyella nitratireducens TaxID=1849580 RepID=A0ABQ1FM33_9GAMM|nr:DoxX family protein [Dyella nitratireducens]GGA19774.1 hypothetical protein GCM10010981_04720 [Dyella nitratireducens]GLQ44466.1 hypothetical protein GCM10007902_43160 [Dyella nitratireducens]